MIIYRWFLLSHVIPTLCPSHSAFMIKYHKNYWKLYYYIFASPASRFIANSERASLTDQCTRTHSIPQAINTFLLVWCYSCFFLLLVSAPFTFSPTAGICLVLVCYLYLNFFTLFLMASAADFCLQKPLTFLVLLELSHLLCHFS